MHELRTERLFLRRWRAEDREPFAAMNADPRVMEFFPATLDREASDAVADRIAGKLEENGFGFWAVEISGVTEFAGFVGLSQPHFEAHFTPCVEIGWRLAHEYWGNGYATEGARASLQLGFDTLELDEIVSFTTPNNLPSRRLMEKIGMTQDEDGSFDHPALPEDYPHRKLVLYRMQASDPRL